MPPKISPPLSPQQLLAQCRWPAAPHQLPARLAPTHQDAGSRALLSLLPPCSQCPMPTVGLGWGRVTPVPWCQPGGPRPLGLTDKAQDPVLKPSRQEAVFVQGRTKRAQEAGDGQPNEQLLKALFPKVAAASVSPCHQAPASQHSPCPSKCLGTKVPAIPGSPSARGLRGSGVGLLSAL